MSLWIKTKMEIMEGLKMKTTKWRLKKPLYIKKSDDRYEKHKKQLEERGFSDTETWSLCSVIAEFIIPRLERFKEIKGGVPMCFKDESEYDKILDKIIFAFKYALKDDFSEKGEKKYVEGIALFSKYFRYLWW